MYIFCDVDETIISNGVILESTRKAVELLRNNGHKVFIASGRSKVEIYPNILALGFDGFVLSNGCVIEYENEIVYLEHMALESVEKICEYCDERKIGYVVDTDNELIGNEYFLCSYALEKFHGDTEKARKNFAAFKLGFAKRKDVTKINVVVHSEKDVNDLRESVCEGLSLRVYNSAKNHYFIEIENKGNSKGKGIERLCKKLNISLENCIAIGDEINDLEMIEMCHIGICMGNGNENVKKKADIIAGKWQDDGFYHVFKELELI